MSDMTDLELMLEFNIGMLDAVCEFLMSPPVFYLLGLICFVILCKAIKIIIH